uniref:Uncharacterized protein n=1 Tax=Solanum tuberosum TaxID=4113 RepID=M1E0V0_SOLTU
MYNFFAATEFSCDDVKVDKHREGNDETKTDNHKVADDLVDQEEIGGDKCAIDEEIGIDCGTEDDETKTDNHKVANDLVDQEEIGGDECAIDEEIDIDCGTKRILELKKVRGKTTCKDIHARNLEERKKVTFDKGQAVGPTVPKDKKKRMWEYINRATKENNEEPSKSEMFIATRTKTGKDLHTDTQVAMAEFQNRQNSGETTDDALRQCLERRSLVELGAMVDQ